jgi:hypothetical protein
LSRHVFFQYEPAVRGSGSRDLQVCFESQAPSALVARGVASRPQLAFALRIARSTTQPNRSSRRELARWCARRHGTSGSTGSCPARTT